MDYEWIFKHLDTGPFYNCYVSEYTYKVIKDRLVNRYECDVVETLYVDPYTRNPIKQKGYILTRRIKG
jgi:hypothetical protein